MKEIIMTEICIFLLFQSSWYQKVSYFRSTRHPRFSNRAKVNIIINKLLQNIELVGMYQFYDEINYCCKCFFFNALQMGDKSCIRENKRYTLSQRVKKYCKPINIFSLYTIARCLLCPIIQSSFSTEYTIKYVQYSDVDVQILTMHMDRLHDAYAEGIVNQSQ